MRLEDQAWDVLKKFRFGRKKSLRETADGAGIDPEILREIESGAMVPTPFQLVSLGECLGFDGDAMEKIHLHPESTPEITPPPGVRPVRENYDDYAVWCTLVLNRENPERALLFDTGGGGRILRDAIRSQGLHIDAVLLTHGHGDHGGGFPGAISARETPVLLNEADRFLLGEIAHHPGPVLTPEEGCDYLRKKGWHVTSMSAPGHTPGSVAYLTEGTLFVGDTIFCGSAGRCYSPEHFATQLSSIHRLLETTSPETVIISGHGPFTTVDFERRWNPFARTRNLPDRPP
jgi:glyoxylase-like metal-dependent hydrolase (beta-lactamase superfamily II)